jgi:heme/copper-type cytochrome/quinol oxidase subunit 2
MNKSKGEIARTVVSRVYWFCILPHFVVVAVIAAAIFCYFVVIAERSNSSPSPESGFEGMFYMLIAMYGIPIVVGIAVLVGIVSFVLAFLPWRGRTTTFSAGLLFILIANAASIAALICSLK